MSDVWKQLKRGIIVSCQAKPGSPLLDSRIICAMAKAAYRGGGAGVRIDGPEIVRAVKKEIPIPVIGINKVVSKDAEVIITPDFISASEIIEAGADILGVDATFRRRPDGLTPAELIRRIKEKFDIQILADISTLEEAIEATKAGADAIATTLSGYTESTCIKPEERYSPNLELLRDIMAAKEITVPVVAEGRFWTPEDVRTAFIIGAHSVVIGKAITNPEAITERFVRMTRNVP